MKKFLLLFAFLFCSLTANAEETFLLDVSTDGKVLTTPEYIIIVDDYSCYDTQLWLPPDNVYVTDDYVINTDNGEKAEIEELMLK